MEADNNIQVEKDKRIITSINDYGVNDDMEGSVLLQEHFSFCMIGPKLRSGSIRIKCDASWKTNIKATAGWLFQDSMGIMFYTDQTAYWAKSAFQAEVMALKFACSAAIALGYRHIDATSDCLNLVGDINQDAAPIICSIISLVSSCHCFSLSHCPRRINRIAHALAKAIA